jgi:hypothetical protein
MIASLGATRAVLGRGTGAGAAAAPQKRDGSAKLPKNYRKITEKYMPDKPYNVIISICYP